MFSGSLGCGCGVLFLSLASLSVAFLLLVPSHHELNTASPAIPWHYDVHALDWISRNHELNKSSPHLRGGQWVFGPSHKKLTITKIFLFALWRRGLGGEKRGQRQVSGWFKQWGDSLTASEWRRCLGTDRRGWSGKTLKMKTLTALVNWQKGAWKKLLFLGWKSGSLGLTGPFTKIKKAVKRIRVRKIEVGMSVGHQIYATVGWIQWSSAEIL